MLTAFQRQIVIGTVLGGSSLVKPPKGVNYYLSMRSTDEKWLRYKMAELSQLFLNQTLYRCGNTFRANSVCSESLTELHAALYDGRKRQVTSTILDPLRDIGIMIWYLEGGGKTGRNRKNAYLNVTKFGESGAAIIKQYFEAVELSCAINHNRNRLRILFSVQGTEGLIRIIGHLIPTYMQHKI